MELRSTPVQKMLFVINPVSGPGETNWSNIIQTYFQQQSQLIELYTIPENATAEIVREKIVSSGAGIAVAVGGDGTIKLVAESLLESNIPLGILPAGSANGMAKELAIPLNPEEALQVLVTGKLRTIHLTQVNGHVCIHLSDIGYNANLIRQFEQQKGRGMFGYLRAAVKALFRHPHMDVTMEVGSKRMDLKAAMVVVANGTQYGSGAVINPVGNLDDGLFEVVVVKKISATEIFKMRFSHTPFNPKKTVVYQTNRIQIRSHRPVHFQVDGEYFGKVKAIEAWLLPAALRILVP